MKLADPTHHHFPPQNFVSAHWMFPNPRLRWTNLGAR
jgi:hypothetical protein